MPSNLNALIRYKTIDRCLRNKYIRCDIRRLQEACSEALGEARGRMETISERTIRDDIRVMRSEILEFNAPIICEDGYYRYSNPNYSIFNVSLSEIGVIRELVDILLKHRNSITHPTFPNVLETLGRLAGIEIPPAQSTAPESISEDDVTDAIYRIITESREAADKAPSEKSAEDEVLKSEFIPDYQKLREPEKDYESGFKRKFSTDLNYRWSASQINWGEILRVL